MAKSTFGPSPGPFIGGCYGTVKTEGKLTKAIEIDIWHRLTLVNSRSMHWTLPFKGRCFYIMFYTPNDYFSLCQDDAASILSSDKQKYCRRNM
jgi:hypothetical protein